MKGKFIVIEGIDGSGKTTQALRLKQKLLDRGYTILHIREPGSTKIGEEIRRILLSKDYGDIHPRTEALLFMAARNELCQKEIIPALKNGKIIILERFHPSTICYQGSQEGITRKEIEKLALLATPDINPDLIIILDITPEEAFKRLKKSRDRFESKGIGYFKKVRNAFLDWAKNKKEALVVDSTLPKEKVAEIVFREVERVIS